MSLREQLEGVAETVPVWLVLAGGIGGLLIALRNIISLTNAIETGGSGFDVAWPVFAIAFGLLLSGYFAYLAFLKRKLKRER
jgi:hypothetical protein